MKASTKRVIVALATISTGAALAWLGGYDFDTRNAWVAYVSFCVLLVSGVLAACPYIEDDEEVK